MTQVYEHSVHQEAIVVGVSGSPHAPQLESQAEGTIEDADYELLEEGQAPHEAAEEDDGIEVEVRGRPAEEKE